MSMRITCARWLAVLGAAAVVAGCGSGQAGQRAAPTAATTDVAAHQAPRQRAAASAAAAESIPAGARVVTITPVGVPLAGAGHQVSVTDPAGVARIAAILNALPLYPQSNDPMWCDIGLPPGGGPALRLTFRASADSSELAVVTAYQDLCQLVRVVIDGTTISRNGAQILIQRAMAIAAVRWPAFPPPGPTAASPVDP